MKFFTGQLEQSPNFEKNYEGNCNWKLLYELSLDEYHVVDVHPGSFGALWGHFKMNDKNHEYYYSGSHSSFLYNKKNGDVWVCNAFNKSCEQVTVENKE